MHSSFGTWGREQRRLRDLQVTAEDGRRGGGRHSRSLVGRGGRDPRIDTANVYATSVSGSSSTPGPPELSADFAYSAEKEKEKKKKAGG